jgi:superfamily II DNA or RNA helicase
MIQFKRNHASVIVTQASETELSELRAALRIFEWRQHEQAIRCVADLFDRSGQSFPSGYLGRVLKRLEKNAVKFEVTDNRVFPLKSPIKDNSKFDPLDWQTEAVDKILSDENGVGFISAPTGSGKSEVISLAIAGIGLKTLLLVPTKNIRNSFHKSLSSRFGSKNVFKEVLVDAQEPIVKPAVPLTSNETEKPKMSKYMELMGYTESKPAERKSFGTNKAKTGLKRSTFGMSKKSNTERKGFSVYVLCYQSLKSLPDSFLESIECVMIDEAHHASAKGLRESLGRLTNAAYKFGFSATPWRDKPHEKKLLEAALSDHVIHEYSIDDAIGDKRVLKPRYMTIDPGVPDVWLKNTRNWRKIVDLGINTNTVRNRSIAEKAKELTENLHNVFICVDEICHLEELSKELIRIGITPIVIHGQQDSEINDEYIAQVGSFTGPIVTIGTMSVGEGTDMPAISAVILAGAGQGSIRLLQRIGRGARIGFGKKYLLVYDMLDWFNVVLKRHSFERLKKFQKYYGAD